MRPLRPPPAAGPWSVYRCYGLAVRSNFPFSFPPLNAAPAADLEVVLTGVADFQPQPVLFVSPTLPGASEPFLSVYRLVEGYRLHYPGAGDFTIAERRIEACPQPGADLALTEDLLLSAVLTFWLELHGVRGLHASAAVLDGAAVAFLGNSGQGKSTLAAALLQDGCPLLSDDILAVEASRCEGESETPVLRNGRSQLPASNGPEAPVLSAGKARFIARPAYPRLRLWPEGLPGILADGYPARPDPQSADLETAAADRYLGGSSAGGRDKVRVVLDHERFAGASAAGVVLARLYLLDRRPPEEAGGQVCIEPLSPRDAVIELLRFSFLPRLSAAAGLQAERLAFFTRLAQAVPVRRLRYPDGREHLPAVIAALRLDRA